MSKQFYRLALVLVLCIGAALRLFHLSVNPPELFNDELDLYVSARSIATTGHDIDGTLQPFLYCRMTRNPPIYAIADYASTLVFGNTPFGQRFPAALFGVLAIALTFALARELTGRRDVALIAAFLQAVQPVAVHFSRVAWEPASELPFLLGGLYALLRALRSGNGREPIPLRPLLLASVLLGLTPYTYQGAWFYALLLGASLIMTHAHRFRSGDARLRLLGAVALGAIVATPALRMQFFDPHTAWRMHAIFTFKNGVNADSIRTFIANYLAHFGWPFLFASGSPEPKYLRGYGELYWWMGPLCAAGVILGSRLLTSARMWWWLLFWLATYPLGGSLTNDDIIPNMPRTLAGIPAFSIFGALGLIALLDLAKLFGSSAAARVYAWSMRGAFALSALGSLIGFCTFYFTVYPRVFAPYWESGNAAAFTDVRKYAPGYQRVCFNGFMYVHIETLARYYLSDVPLDKIEDDNDSRCFLPGTLLLSALGSVDRAGFSPIAYATRIDGSPYAVLEARPPQPPPAGH